MPQIDEIIQRQISRVYFSGNMISSLSVNYFEKWYSLQYIDLTKNMELHCDQLIKIPEHVVIDTECMEEAGGK